LIVCGARDVLDGTITHPPMLLGAIDVGTNSIHLIVVEMDPRFGTSRTILKAREMVRLGGGEALARGHLSKKAIQRGVAAIAKFADAARHAGASDVRAVATSAVRESSNRDEFLAAVRAASGVEVEVLGDVEEARLIHLGVSRGYPFGGKTACIFDIGGGSTEFIVGDAERPFFLHSVRLGSLRLYDDYLRDESPSALAYRALDKHVRETLAPVAARLGEYRFDTLIGTSGTVLGLAALDAAATGAGSQRAHGYVLHLDRLRALQREMAAMTPAERRKMPGMNPRRSDIIVAGNAIVIAVLDALGRDELVVSERALREGIVVDYLERNIAIARRLGDERTRRFDAAHELARRFGALDVHENHVAALALQLYDGLADLHRFEPAERDALFAAALVHDVGRAIAPSAHHKHGAYIVRNAGLVGWRAEEVELIAALVRYHRKSLPKPTHPEYAIASPAIRRKIEMLGGILRVADGLDRRRLAAVSGIRVASAPGRIHLTLESLQDVAPEIDAARFKGDLLERAFASDVAFEAVPRDPYASSFGEREPSAAEIDAPSLPT
jgi:exopolyphosphatase/guanosine-5'-triphosphate,3'-diphosphate pyrophosphatase